MNNDIIVSVIIPTYNRAEYVQEAIESVLSQTYKDYELIVVDDGSTDKTQEIIKSKYGGKLTYIWQKNQGRSAARNLGISSSKGKYLGFLDSDDKWHPEKLYYQVLEIEKRREKEKNIALVCSSVWLIDSNGGLITRKLSGRTKNIEKVPLSEYLYRPCIFAPPSNALYFADYVKEVGGFDLDLPPVEDRGLLIKLREKFKFIYFDKPLTYYRIHNLNQQGMAEYSDIDKKLLVTLKLIERFPKSMISEIDFRKAIADTYEKSAFLSLLYNDWEKGKAYIQKSIDSYPQSLFDLDKTIQKVASEGYLSAKFNKQTTTPDILNYFENWYYPNLQNLYPEGILSCEKNRKKIIATLSHILLCDKKINKTNNDAVMLGKQAFTYSRYIRSLSTWKYFLKNLLHITII